MLMSIKYLFFSSILLIAEVNTKDMSDIISGTLTFKNDQIKTKGSICS